ncbi:OstA-like protein [Paraflavitalea pollutisoli]|uniref:OstA-like protein n=1 Tax=Paraflavitalea pollutisoli TaxID=3034143 RepID=UPI0023EBB7AE|nr:OstA-like protein [Paraflavitalea sp. H1-2-19X]
MRRFLNLLVALLLLSTAASAQVTVTPQPGADSVRVVDLIYADKIRLETVDTTVDLQILVGKVHLKQGKTHFFGDSVIYNKKTRIVEAFGHVHINDADSIHTYADKLLYYVDTKKAILTNNARLTDGKSTLTTNELHYDSNEKIGEYFNGGKVVNSKSVLTSKEATYYGDLKDVYFKKEVVLIDPAYQLRSDSLLYNTNTEVTTFITKTYIKDSSQREIETKEGFYDLKNKKAEFGKRPTMIDAKARTRTTADFVDINDSTGITTLTGRAVHVDSVQSVSVLANYMWVNKKDETFFATQNPLMIIKQDKDSIYVTADTLYSGRLSKLKVLTRTDSSTGKLDTIKGAITLNVKEKPKNDSADRYFQGYHHVRIFSDSLQAVSDSMFYSGADSVFQLFTDPIAWANNSQITGDTMYLYTKDKKPSRLYVFENGFAVNKVGKDMYNQLRGNRMNGYFVDGNIDYMRSKGNAESVFYVMDEDSALVGVNKAEGDIIDLRFLNKELNKVVVISEPKATMFPAKQTTEQDKLLRNFRWLEARRPKTKFELFGN